MFGPLIDGGEKKLQTLPHTDFFLTYISFHQMFSLNLLFALLCMALVTIVRLYLSESTKSGVRSLLKNR